ncbi:MULTISPECIES: ATP-binding protein [Streptomyces]|nr:MULTISPECIES: ATP-binding protein [Streptomyces]MYR10072.1 ATP-binding protein [Streptomyces sp. SID724]MYR54467.1 ATP-binding protein [Streptomyces sp. SID4928]MYT82018.1 ATP-binding protein [Streptomyces sp. SID8364]EGE46463.1 regulatory protein [Streptomyces sp. ACT-1]NEB53038.1 ATP-binding protein [Streptomyces griseus]
MTYGRTEQERREAAGTSTMQDGAAYEMTSGEVANAREFVRDFLARAQTLYGESMSQRAVDVAQLVVSELATNVCKYAPGPCLLDLETDGTALGITMWDSGSVLPSASPADPTRVGRHGLELVLMVCQSFEIRREPVGKRVRVRLSLQDSPSGDPAGQTTW